MKLSVIVPFYNSKINISGTLDSLINQSYKDFIVYFIDDGSFDGTSEYIKNYLKDTNVCFEILRTEHRGVSHARNIGLKHVSSQYIIFLDSDDYIELNMFEILMNTVEDKNLDLVWCAYDHVKNEKIVWSYSHQYLNIQGIGTGPKLLNDIFDNKTHIITSSVLYSKKLLENLNFNEKIFYHEDLEFYYKAISRARRVYFIDKVLVHYLMRDDSLSHNLTYEKLDHGLIALTSLYEELSNQEIDSSIINKINYLVIPRTVYVFFNYFCLDKDSIAIFKSKGYLHKMDEYKLVSLHKKTLELFFKIKFAAKFPYLFKLLKKLVYLFS